MPAAALAEWRAAIGPEYVLTGEEVAPYLVNCLSLDRFVPAALRPENEHQVREVVRIAARHHISLYPFSTGHNWGYGTSLPVEDGGVVLDLSRMDRILELDAELGLITVEPGVTQAHLSQHLRQAGLDFFVPTTGAGPTVSLLGNALERGFGITPEEDHFGAVRSLRAVLPDATIYQSPLPSLGMPTSQTTWKWGIGPYLDGIFTQGNFGIVTAMTIALRPRPEHIEVYVFTLKDHDRFSQLVCRCRDVLVSLRGLAGGIKFMNQAQFRLTLDTSELGMGLSSDFAWVGFGVLHCRKSLARAARRAVKEALAPFLSQIVFLNDSRVRLFRTLANWAPGALGVRMKRQAQQARDVLQIVRGVPRDMELRLVYQHVPIPPGGLKDPVKEGVGVIWYAPIVPLKQALIDRMVEIIATNLKKHGFPEAVSLTTVNERCAMGVIPIIYRRPEDKDKAHRCFQTLWEQGRDAGCYPYRLNIAVMDQLPSQGESFWHLAKLIKRAVDPDRLFSPGRYGI